MKRLLIVLFSVSVLLASCCGPKDGEYTFRILSTNDVHGHYFDSLYTSGGTANSLMSLAWYVDSIRVADGPENVLLIDAGDCLHGDNAAYYYNYVDTTSEHVYARMLEYMKYDAWIPGNHDIETGHPVYDRIAGSLDVPVLAANALRTSDGMPYFREYVILKRHGLKIAVIGFTNPNISNVYAPELWEGMSFEPLFPDFTQSVVDRVRDKEEPDVVIVAIHSGAGRGDGSQLEQQGLDLFSSLEGVDFIISAHDHIAAVYEDEDMCMFNTGNYCTSLGYGSITLNVKDGKVVDRKLSAELIKVDRNNVDKRMQEYFRPDYEAVKGFFTRQVGSLKSDMNTRDALFGVSDYMNLVHTVCLEASGAQISLAAPSIANRTFSAGTLVYEDIMTLCSQESQLSVVKMTGEKVKEYLEKSYGGWINTLDGSSVTLLNMRSLFMPADLYSAGGLVYSVDVTRPAGSRIIITSLSDGTAFDMSAEYDVAMGPSRALLNDYIEKNGEIDPARSGDRSIVGFWSFIPEKDAEEAFSRDMARFTRRR